MQVQIQKWGNSLAFRIPSAFANETNLCQGSVVDLGVREGKLIVTPILKKKISLESLLKGITKENVHREEDFGERQGRESW